MSVLDAIPTLPLCHYITSLTRGRNVVESVKCLGLKIVAKEK